MATYDGKVLEAGVLRIPLNVDEAYEISMTIQKYLIAQRIRRQREQEHRGQVWVTRYMRHKVEEFQTYYSLYEAVQFLAVGWENCDLYPIRIECPDGEVISMTDTHARFSALMTSYREGNLAKPEEEL